jgi:outer membrane protein TolC
LLLAGWLSVAALFTPTFTPVLLAQAATPAIVQPPVPQPANLRPAAAPLQTPQPQSQQFQTNPSSTQNAYYGSVTRGTATTEVLHLSLDDAIARGIQNNLALTEARIQQEQADAQRLEALDKLLPAIAADASTSVHQFNLAAFGFTPGLLQQVAPSFPSLNPAAIKLIVKVDVTRAEATYRQTFFDLSAIERYRSAKVNTRSAFYNMQSSRGLVVLNVGDAYLQALADGAQVDSATSLMRADDLLLQQATAEHEAGTAANLDELRARVQFQAQQQRVIAAQNTYDKDLILIKREIGVPVEQPIQLTDAAPYADLETMQIEEAKRQAYTNRQDYLGMQQQLLAADLNRKAAKFERLPTLGADGDYGVTGVTHGLYHGTFLAEGTFRVPLFKEAQFRGDAQVATAQRDSVQQQLANLRAQIDQQLRDSILDIQSSQELVRVAQSNVALATKEVEQANDRFVAGVDTNLALVQAQATLAGAQSQLINDTLTYNQAKLGLARNLGIVDTQYRAYLHGR